MTLPQDITNLQSKVSAAVREHWKAFLFEGILLAILGLAAIIVPPLAGLAVKVTDGTSCGFAPPTRDFRPVPSTLPAKGTRQAAE